MRKLRHREVDNCPRSTATKWAAAKVVWGQIYTGNHHALEKLISEDCQGLGKHTL